MRTGVDSVFIDQLLQVFSLPPFTVNRFIRDRNGVVWYTTEQGGAGFMSSADYDNLRTLNDRLPDIEDLPFFDNRQQNIVAID